MNHKILSTEQKQKLLEIQPLTELPDHAVSLAMGRIIKAVERKFEIKANVERGSSIVSIKNNFDKLNYSLDEPSRKDTYTHYVSQTDMFRTQMTSTIPPLMESLDQSKSRILWCCPGMVYRRDVVDKTHVGQPHQMDIWYLTREKILNREDLLSLVDAIVEEFSVILGGPKLKYRYNETEHNYTEKGTGIEVEIFYNNNWLEILECGLAGKSLMANSGLSNDWNGLALGMGLDRMVMIVKGIQDIRILREKDPRIATQLRNLNPYKIVSNQPMIRRDMSITVDGNTTIEDLTEEIMSVVEDPSIVEEIKVISQTPYENLPLQARISLGMIEGQQNWLVRIILRHLTKSITTEEANTFGKKVYAKIHKGLCQDSLKAVA